MFYTQEKPQLLNPLQFALAFHVISYPLRLRVKLKIRAREGGTAKKSGRRTGIQIDDFPGDRNVTPD